MNHHPEKGAALVEFALVMPILAMFLLGIVQFGMAYDAKQSINAAAREGARLAAIPAEPSGADPGTTYEAIAEQVTAVFGEPPDTITVTVHDPGVTLPVRTCTDAGCTPTSAPASASPCTGQAGRTVVVTATRDHDLTIPFVGVRVVTLTGRGEFRCEA